MTDSASSSDASSGPDLSNRELGDYRVLRRLGQGGMADVYLAEQKSLRRMVALKVLKPDLASNDLFVRRFHHEARAAARLVHANIVQIHEVGCIDGIDFIAQEYVQGQNLKEFVARQGALTPPRFATILRQITAALHKSASEGVIHRDIKPENILLGPEGEVKVADFGLARVNIDSEAQNLTEVGITLGTPLYMSPEQIEGRPLDSRSDIYSLGVTCYYMLTGRAPFEGDTALAVAVQHLQTQPPRLEQARPDLPEGLCRIVHKMMAKKASDRHENASHLLRDLRELRIEGLDEAWAEAFDEWSPSEWLALSERRLDATQQLDAVMKASARLDKPVVRKGMMVMTITTALIVGGLSAWWSQPSSLLSVDRPGASTVIPRRESPEAQFIYAAMVNNESAWKSIADFFPPDESETNKYYVRRAQQQLAQYYVEREEYDQALSQYGELASLDSTEEQFRAFGLAGESVVFSLLHDYEKSAQKVADVWPLLDQLDSDTRDEVKRVRRRNSQALAE